MKSQITNTVLMIRPASFRMNEETAVNNYFQKQSTIAYLDINKKAQFEFDQFVKLLRSKDIEVIVVNEDPTLNTPDALFPNNWISFHQDGRTALYPMFAENRRRERREEVLLEVEKAGYQIETIVDYTLAEEEAIYLEGTGSLILDRVNRKAYCAISPRADEELLIEFCEDFEYTPIIFEAKQTINDKRLPIYHTNVMMCIAENFVVICSASIDDKKQRKLVLNSLKLDNKEIVEISESQLHQFAGNMLQLKAINSNAHYLVMSQAAHNCLASTQIKQIEKYCEIISSDLSTIELHGGGSARCMLAEVFLPRKN